MSSDVTFGPTADGFYEQAYRDAVPCVLPHGWVMVAQSADGGMFRRADGLGVITSAGIEADGKRWLHVSCSRAARLPSYEDLAEAKRVFVGDGRAALQVFAPRARHVNIHPNCLHLWCCLDGDPLPDFTRGTGTL